MSDEEASLDALTIALGALSMAGHDGLADRLVRLTAAVAKEAAARPSFAKALEVAMSSPTDEAPTKRDSTADRAGRRRSAPVLDPYSIHREAGPDVLRHQLSSLSVEQLKDIIAEHGMDRDKLAMKWKTPDRLIDRILTTVSARAQKGDVFRR